MLSVADFIHVPVKFCNVYGSQQNVFGVWTTGWTNDYSWFDYQQVPQVPALLLNVQTGSGYHTASYPVITGRFVAGIKTVGFRR